MKKTKVYTWLMAGMSRMMISCESAGILICKKQHEKLVFRERIALKMHLMGCKLCRRFEEDMIVVQKGIDKYSKASPEKIVHARMDDNQRIKIREELIKQSYLK